ncbi:MAG: type II toxin-antitoxin system VapC family toxin [Pirellulales bacterium]|nr:type II toxin-antitoxin system VapC family toxin [Pirellulales bacterium]
MMPSVYLETTIPSYLTAWRSPELVMAARQQITREWWDSRRQDFELFVSQLVIDEASAGDSTAATRRLEALEGITLLEFGDDANALSKLLIRQLSLPVRAESDAVHIALAVVNGMDYLLTWNCTHIANATLRPRIEEACRAFGYRMPVICTPEELHAVPP